ncbi:MAG: hypothetical protein NC211_02670 [Alistipes senegalensis]|nr:hypothetical protein [Oxalobacter formigenes]MCM1280727.1 hypothetical protein [Alistipes senegalensis]
MANTFQDDVTDEINKAIRNKADLLALDGCWHKGRLSTAILDIPSLRHLSLSHYYVDMPAWIADIASLESLEIEEAHDVGGLLPFLWKLKNLCRLKLAYVDGLTDLPASFGKLRNLQDLNVDGADFQQFPAVISSLSSLRSLSYHYCDCALPEVFDSLAGLPQLTRLHFTHYGDDGGDFLPESFTRMHALEEMDFSQWIDLNALPENIGEMRNLRVINLSNSDYQMGRKSNIRELPESLGELHNLEELDVFGVQDLTKLPSSFRRLSRLKRIDTVCSGIKVLSLTENQWRNLESLRIQGPLPDLRLCENLKMFYWYKNAVSVDRDMIPRGTNEVLNVSLSPLINLEKLIVTGGSFESLDFLLRMKNLRYLSLSCDFEDFPAGFEQLSKLEDIRIWGAKSLSVLPESLGYLPSLKYLQIVGCSSLKDGLPKSVCGRKDLRVEFNFCVVQIPE